jgi:hypothetical protein
MKKLSKKKLDELGIKRYIQSPSLYFVGGIKIKPGMTFDDSETDEKYDNDGNVIEKTIIKQHFEDMTLTTTVKTDFEYNGFIETRDYRTVTKYPDNREIILVFENGKGWGIPNTKISLVETAIRDIELLKNKE